MSTKCSPKTEVNKYEEKEPVFLLNASRKGFPLTPVPHVSLLTYVGTGSLNNLR
jgi:hypothetical protein